MDKLELQTGMWVRTRNGKWSIVLLDTQDGDIISGQGWSPLDSYDRELKYIGSSTFGDNSMYDIVEIRQPMSNAAYMRPARENIQEIDGDTIWTEDNDDKNMIDDTKGMDARIQIGEQVIIAYDEPKWECGKWYSRKEEGEIVDINRDYFTVLTSTGLEVEYYNDSLKEKTRYGYGLIYFSSTNNVRMDYSSAENAPIMYGGTPIGIVKRYDEKGFIECVLWDRFTDVEKESNGQKIHTITVHGGNVRADSI